MPPYTQVTPTTTIGELLKQHIALITPETPEAITIEMVVNKIQNAIKDGLNVKYENSRVYDIGILNAINAKLFIFKTDGGCAIRLDELNICELCKAFTYTKTEQLF